MKNKVFKIVLWIIFFPFMLTYWGWRKEKKPAMVAGLIMSVILIIASLGGEDSKQELASSKNDVNIENSNESNDKEIGKVIEDLDEEINEIETNYLTEETNGETIEIAIEAEQQADNKEDISVKELFEGYTIIEVYGGELSGNREPEVAVNIGFGNRDYWAFTNKHGQLVKIIAKEIILQDEEIEQVTSSGRYYHDEAKVPGVESDTLDEGHVIADSLGGVSNAYNITPQNSVLNRHGEQAYMEKVIRDALNSGGTCIDFEANIDYPDTETQIPSHYSFTYTLNGNVINDEFANINPDQANEFINNEKTEGTANSENKDTNVESELPEEIGKKEAGIIISDLNKKEEYVILTNTSETSVNISGWYIVSVLGGQKFTFPQYSLDSNVFVKVGDSEKNLDVNFHWMEGRGVWNNSKSDPAELYDNFGNLIHRFDD